jgi:hypothetical protein
LPNPILELLDFMRYVPQRGENQSPSELRRCVGQAAVFSRYDDAALGAGRYVDMHGVVAGLRNDLQAVRELFDDGARQRRALLRRDQGIDAGQPVSEARAIVHVLSEDYDFVVLEALITVEGAKGVLIVIDDGNFDCYSS